MRFAQRVFAEVIHRHMPEVDIYNYKGMRIGNTVLPMLRRLTRTVSSRLWMMLLVLWVSQTWVFVAVSVYSKHYSSENGVDQNILGMAKIQDAAWMHPCGLELSKGCHEAASAEKEIGMLAWPSVEFERRLLKATTARKALSVCRIRKATFLNLWHGTTANTHGSRQLWYAGYFFL